MLMVVRAHTLDGVAKYVNEPYVRQAKRHSLRHMGKFVALRIRRSGLTRRERVVGTGEMTFIPVPSTVPVPIEEVHLLDPRHVYLGMWPKVREEARRTCLLRSDHHEGGKHHHLPPEYEK